MKLLSNWNERREELLKFDTEALEQDVDQIVKKYMSGDKKVELKDFSQTLEKEIMESYKIHCGFPKVSEEYWNSRKLNMSDSFFPLTHERIEWLKDYALTVPRWAQEELEKINNISADLQALDFSEPDQTKEALLLIIDEFKYEDYDDRWFGPISDGIYTILYLSNIEYPDFDLDDIMDKYYQSWIAPEPSDTELLVDDLQVQFAKQLFDSKYK